MTVSLFISLQFPCLLTLHCQLTGIAGESQDIMAKEANQIFGLSDCFSTVLLNGVCAILFDDNGCEGWKIQIPFNTTNVNLPVDYQNDAESLIVRKDCLFNGYGDKGESEILRGSKVTYDARNIEGEFLVRDLDKDSLNDDIESLDCICYSNDIESQKMNSLASLSNITPGKCEAPQLAFCAILFDNEDCRLSHWTQPFVLISGDKKNFSQASSRNESKYQNEAESLIVKAGCVLEAFENSDFLDKGILLEGKTEDLFINLENHPNKEFANLDENIESVICNCSS